MLLDVQLQCLQFGVAEEGGRSGDGQHGADLDAVPWSGANGCTQPMATAQQG